MQNFFDQFDTPAPAPAPTTPGIIRGRTTQPTPIQLEDQTFKRNDEERKNRNEIRQEGDTNFSQIDKLAERYNKLPEVKNYRVAVQQLATALDTTPDPQGDLALTYAFAKAMDPDSVVREAEQGMVSNSQPWVIAAVERAKKEFGMDGAGAYTPETRKAIRAQIINAVEKRVRLYDQNRAYFEKMARDNNFDPYAVIGEHDGKPFVEQLRAYDAENVKQEDPELVEFEPNPNLVVGTDGRIYDKRTGQPVETNPTDPESLGQAFYAGVGDVAQGVGEALGLVANPLNAGINAIAGTNLSTDLGQTFRDATGAPQGDPLASAINRAGTSVLTTAGISGLARPVAQGAGQFVADAFAQQPVRRSVAEGANTVARTLSQEPIRQAVGGASAGAAAELARQAGANPLLQAAAGLAGGVGGYGAAGIPQALMRPQQANSLLQVAQPANSRLIPNAQQVVDDGRAINTRVMTSDIRPPKTRMGKMLRNIGDSIPIAGTAGPRAGQQTERVDAVQKLMKEFGADETAIEAVSKDLIKTRGEAIKKLTTAKDSVIKNIKGEVPAPKAIAEIDKQIAKLTGIDEEAFKPVINRLNGFKTALQSGKTLEQVEGQRRLLGDLFADASLASIKGDGQKAINAIYNPLKEDMAAFIEATAGPAAKAKWAGANERLAAMAGELDASAFKSLLNNAETTPESAAKIIFGKTPSDMKRLYGSLSDKGKAKAQSAIMFQALEKSTSNDMISPQKFATAMEAMSKATGVFFSPADKARIDGITRLIKATQHASDAAANPMTGAQNTPLIAGLSIGQIFGTAALPVTAAAGLLARVYESAPVRDAFLRLGRSKAGSPQEQGAMARALTAIAAANDNPEMAAFAQTAPGSARAAASEGQEKREERPIKP